MPVGQELKEINSPYFLFFVVNRLGCNSINVGDSGKLAYSTQTSSRRRFTYSWCITGTNGQDVSLEFFTLDIETCFDAQLDVFNGRDSTGTLLATYCGKNATSPRQVRSRGSDVYVLLQSSGKTSVYLSVRFAYTTRKDFEGTVYNICVKNI